MDFEFYNPNNINVFPNPPKHSIFLDFLIEIRCARRAYGEKRNSPKLTFWQVFFFYTYIQLNLLKKIEPNHTLNIVLG